jgi:hypothetical protein
MYLNLDRRMMITDDDPGLSFFVSQSDKDDFELVLKGFSLPVLQLTGVSKEQLVSLREQINEVLGSNRSIKHIGTIKLT